jgi:hypothetical protein
MTVDKTWHCDHIRGFYDLSLSNVQITPDRDNDSVANLNVAGRKIAERRIHCDDSASADEDRSPLRMIKVNIGHGIFILSANSRGLGPAVDRA